MINSFISLRLINTVTWVALPILSHQKYYLPAKTYHSIFNIAQHLCLLQVFRYMINDTQLVKMKLTASIWHGLASVWRHKNCVELCDQQKLCAHSRMYIENVLFLLISKAVQQHPFNRNIDYDKNTVWFSVTRPTCKQKLGLHFTLSFFYHTH